MSLVPAGVKTLLPFVLKVDLLLFLDLSFLKRARSAIPIIDLRRLRRADVLLRAETKATLSHENP